MKKRPPLQPPTVSWPPTASRWGSFQAFQGGKSVGVPGNIALMAETHKKWGKLPWSTIFKPAIRLADKGFVVNKTLEIAIGRHRPFVVEIR